MTNITVHPFEKAGLGTAPFRCVGMMTVRPQDAWEACRDTGLSVCCCAYCGTGIIHNFIIRGATGRQFVVGSDCVGRTGDAGLVQEIKTERKRIATELRAKRNAQAAAERKAAYEVVRLQRAADFETLHSDLVKRARAVVDMEAKGGFVADVILGGLAGRYVSDKAIAAVTAVIVDLERRATWNSQHVGTVGKRATFAVEVDRVAHFESMYGIVWIVTMRDEAGNALVSKSTSFRAERGKKLTIKATVKEHSEYRDEKQTVIQRIKVGA